jgi:hypothetical protein
MIGSSPRRCMRTERRARKTVSTPVSDNQDGVNATDTSRENRKIQRAE